MLRPVKLIRCLTAMQNLGLAVRGFKAMLTEHSSEPGVSQSVLVIAGGYDKRLAENREHYEELVDLIAELGLQSKVGTFGLHVSLSGGLSRSEAWLGTGVI